jgi:predicted nucleic acid-binding protein
MNDEVRENQLVFVDTNILVYAYDHTAGTKYSTAVELVKRLWEMETGCISIQILQEFFVITSRKITKPLGSDLIKEIISDLANWRLHTPEVTDLLRAIDIQQKNKISFWDAMVVQSALKLGCSTLLSEDLNDGQSYEGMQVVNPFIIGVYFKKPLG